MIHTVKSLVIKNVCWLLKTIYTLWHGVMLVVSEGPQENPVICSFINLSSCIDYLDVLFRYIYDLDVLIMTTCFSLDSVDRPMMPWGPAEAR